MKISVIIPILNTEWYVEDCLQSVMKQSFLDVEIICIEDGGRDRSADIVRKMMQEDSRISLHLNRYNLGPGATRNRGLDQAKGKYIFSGFRRHDQGEFTSGIVWDS